MRPVLSIFALIVVPLAVACRGDNDSSPPTIHKAVDAMRSLDSYYAAFTARPLYDSAGPFVWDAEFQAPNDYRFLMFGAAAGGGAGCSGGFGSGEAQEPICESWTEETSQPLLEKRYVGDIEFTRECEDIDKGCTIAEESERSTIPIVGFNLFLYLPHWPIVAVESATDWQELDAEKLDGLSFLRLRGSVDAGRAMYESAFRDVELTCELTNNERLMEEECNEFESSKPEEPEAGGLPATIEAWISAETNLVHRISFEHETLGGEFSVTYSRFNEVTIEPPNSSRH